MSFKVKIYGYGFVGKAMHTLFPAAYVSDPSLGMDSDEKCDVALVCVPTPLLDGRLDTSIVQDVIESSEEELIIVRSTVNPGDCDYWERTFKKEIVFQPEYLGETVSHPLMDQHDRPFIIIGGKPENRRRAIELYQEVYNANVKIRQDS